MISKKKVIFFTSISNIVIINLICYTTLCTIYTNSAWIYLAFHIVISMLICFLFKGIPENINILLYIKKNYLLRSLISIYLISVIALLSMISAVVIKKYFYFNANIMTIYLLIITTSLIVSLRGFKNIINLGVLIFIPLTLFYIIPFIHYKERDFMLLLPFDFNILDIYKCFHIIIFPLENILFFLGHNSIKKGFSRSTLVLSTLFTGLYLLFILIDGITLTGANFYVNMHYGGLMHWQLFQGNLFIENFVFLLIIILIATTIFRVSFYIENFRKLTYQKKSLKVNIGIILLFLVLGLVLYLALNFLDKIFIYSLYIDLGIISIIFLIVCFISYKLNKGEKS